MSKINQIQEAIQHLDGGAFQKLMDAYLVRKFGFSNIMPYGSHTGTNKTTKGTPDSYVRTKDGKYIFIAYGTKEPAYNKMEQDILSCLDKSKTGIEISDIEQIICCHTSTNISPGQEKSLCSHFKNTLIINIGTVSYDIYLQYPVLARDFLSIDIDTHQIFDVADFLKYSSNNVYATTLDIPLLCRDQELNTLADLIRENSVVFVCGKLGVGKTRLTLEAVKKYGNDNNYTVKVIRSNGEYIYDDLYATFTDDQDFLVFVDDADQLAQLKHLLDLCVSVRRVHHLKVIMTVRDYAKDHVLRTTISIVRPAIYQLSPLKSENIRQILSETLEIKNEVYLKQILHISKGNIRLAIMAGECAKKQPFDSIRNAFDIFDYYFNGIIDKMQKKEIITAALIAFFDSFPISREEKPFEIAVEQGICFEDFEKICYTLHKNEVISIYKNLAVKFENQNLRDYLLYYVFYKSKWLTPSYIIKKAFPQYRRRIVYAFNTLVQLFSTEENLQYLQSEIRTAWQEIKCKSDATIILFIETFAQVIPDESLLVIKRKIDNIPEIHTDFLVYDFKKNRNYQKIESSLIQILVGFKYTNQFDDAIQLSLYYLEHNTEHPMDFYFLYGKIWGFDKDSYKYAYSQEKKLIKTLFEYFQTKGTIEAALCLIFCVENCLGFEFDATEDNQDNTISFYRFSLTSCEEVYNIRSLCYQSLAFLFNKKEFKQYASNALLGYGILQTSDNNKTILEHDISSFAQYFGNLLDAKSFEDCNILYHYCKICEFNDVPLTEFLLEYKKNHTYILSVEIRNDRLSRRFDWENKERERKSRITKLCQTVDLIEFRALWAELKKSKGIQKDEWDISQGIGIIFESLSEEPHKFFDVLESYIEHDTPFDSCFPIIIGKLVELFGYEKALNFIKSRKFSEKEKWIAEICNHIPSEKIENDAANLFIEKLNEQKNNKQIYALSLSTALRVNLQCPGFIVRYFMAINDACESHNWLAIFLLEQVCYGRVCECHDFVELFSEHIDVLEKAYLLAQATRESFDYQGNLLIQIINKDISFVKKVVASIIMVTRYYATENNLMAFWDQENYLDLIDITIETIRADSSKGYYHNMLAEHLLTHEKGNATRWEKQDTWLTSYIQRNCSDDEKMKFLFSDICNLPDEQRGKAVLSFANTIVPFLTFKR